MGRSARGEVSVSLLLLTLICCSLWPLCLSSDGCQIRYGRRGCYHRVLNGVLVTCDGRNMEKKHVVPQNLPSDTVYLSLVNFNLEQLTQEQFSRFGDVECMTIMHSGITAIASDAFSGMQSLHEIVMENTSISNGHLNFMVHPQFTASLVILARSPHLRSVNISASPNLREIQTLGLYDNAIEILDGSVFTELRNTEKLILTNNKLRSLDWTRLKEMIHLNKLSLDANRIQTIPEDVHSVFYAVKELFLAGNPFHCNCKLRWLREFYEDSIDKKLDFTDVMCVSPHDMPMSRVLPRDFLCQKPSEPVIEYLRLDHNRYEVNCSSTGDPAPTLEITLPNERTIIAPPSGELSKVRTITPQLLSHAGVIRCEATNSEGFAAREVHLPDIVLGSGASRPAGYTSLFLACCLLLRLVCCRSS